MQPHAYQPQELVDSVYATARYADQTDPDVLVTSYDRTPGVEASSDPKTAAVAVGYISDRPYPFKNWPASTGRTETYRQYNGKGQWVIVTRDLDTGQTTIGAVDSTPPVGEPQPEAEIEPAKVAENFSLVRGGEPLTITVADVEPGATGVTVALVRPSGTVASHQDATLDGDSATTEISLGTRVSTGSWIARFEFDYADHTATREVTFEVTE